MRSTTYIIVIISAVVWFIPIALNSALIADQYTQGNGSMFLIAIGILPYVAALLFATAGPILLLHFHREKSATILAGVMLGAWVPAALFWAMGMGST